MPVMTPAELMVFFGKEFPQAAREGMAIDHLDETTIRLHLPTQEQHLRPGGTVSGPTLVGSPMSASIC
jgi:acyl-coenzyme A thioesterase PaaI-like protein